MKLKVLDHGFVELLNVSGPVRRTTESFKQGNPEDGYWEDIVDRTFDASDTDPAITARISFNNFKEERTYEQDMKLVEYLIKNHHNTPIEMIETWWHVKLPIFVARQFIRHRTACVNEISARYSVLPEEFYIPEIVGGKPTNGMKQGQEDNLSEEDQKKFKDALYAQSKEAYKQYNIAISSGVAPEHARLFLPLNIYSEWVWKMDLHNLMHFLNLRLDKHAQIEARAYAEAKYNLLSIVLPGIMNLFDKYRKNI